MGLKIKNPTLRKPNQLLLFHWPKQIKRSRQNLLKSNNKCIKSAHIMVKSTLRPQLNSQHRKVRITRKTFANKSQIQKSCINMLRQNCIYRHQTLNVLLRSVLNYQMCEVPMAKWVNGAKFQQHQNRVNRLCRQQCLQYHRLLIDGSRSSGYGIVVECNGAGVDSNGLGTVVCLVDAYQPICQLEHVVTQGYYDELSIPCPLLNHTHSQQQQFQQQLAAAEACLIYQSCGNPSHDCKFMMQSCANKIYDKYWKTALDLWRPFADLSGSSALLTEAPGGQTTNHVRKTRAGYGAPWQNPSNARKPDYGGP